MKNTSKKIIKLAEKSFKERISADKLATKSRIEKDKEVIEKIIKFVEKHLVYKEVGETYNKKYVVVTEDILFEDYTTKPKYSWNEGTKFEGEGEKIKITVNGHYYYHLAGILEDYKKTIDKAIEKSSYEYDQLREKRDYIEKLTREEPNIKQMMLDYASLINSFKEDNNET